MWRGGGGKGGAHSEWVLPERAGPVPLVCPGETGACSWMRGGGYIDAPDTGGANPALTDAALHAPPPPVGHGRGGAGVGVGKCSSNCWCTNGVSSSLMMSCPSPPLQVQPLVAASVVLARTLHDIASPGGVPVVPLKVSPGHLMLGCPCGERAQCCGATQGEPRAPHDRMPLW